MDWSLVVNGFLGDAEKTAELYERLKGILSTPQYGTTNSQFWGQGIQESGFHTDPAAASGPAADSAETAPPSGSAAETGSQATEDAPQGAGQAAESGEHEADPTPA